MTDLREALYNYLSSVTSFEVINAMVHFKEPDTYVSFYVLNDDTNTITNGNRLYNATDDLIDIDYTFVTSASVQIDVRGDGSYEEAKRLFFLFQISQEEMKIAGLFYREVNNVTAIPNVQNGYAKEGYQFTLVVGYDATITKQIQIGETIQWH